jgi:hypothetical protein
MSYSLEMTHFQILHFVLHISLKFPAYLFAYLFAYLLHILHISKNYRHTLKHIIQSACRDRPTLGNGAALGPTHLKWQQLFVFNVWWWCQSIIIVQGWLKSLLATFWMPLNESWIFFVLSIVPPFLQEHEALIKKSESPMATDCPIELTTNLHQSIQPISNNYNFSKKGNKPCSGRVNSYIPSLTIDFQQVRHRAKYTMPLATSCRVSADSSKSNRYSTAHTDSLHFIIHHIFS